MSESHSIQVIEHLVPIQEFAELYNVHPATVRRWIYQGHIPVRWAPAPNKTRMQYVPLEEAERLIRKNARITWRKDTSDRRRKGVS